MTRAQELGALMRAHMGRTGQFTRALYLSYVDRKALEYEIADAGTLQVDDVLRVEYAPVYASANLPPGYVILRPRVGKAELLQLNARSVE